MCDLYDVVTACDATEAEYSICDWHIDMEINQTTKHYEWTHTGLSSAVGHYPDQMLHFIFHRGSWITSDIVAQTCNAKQLAVGTFTFHGLWSVF